MILEFEEKKVGKKLRAKNANRLRSIGMPNATPISRIMFDFAIYGYIYIAWVKCCY